MLEKTATEKKNHNASDLKKKEKIGVFLSIYYVMQVSAQPV